MDNQIRDFWLPAVFALVYSATDCVGVVVIQDGDAMPEETRPLIVLFRHKMHADCRVCDHIALVRLHDRLVDSVPMHAWPSERWQGSRVNVEGVARIELLYEFEPTRERKEVSSALAR